MKPLAVLLLVVGCSCSSKPASKLSAKERDETLTIAKQCTDTIPGLAPSFQMIGPKLASALKMDRAEARRLMRDTVELLISSRELLCGMSAATVDNTLAKAPGDEEILAAKARVQGAVTHLAKARAAYDQLLGATTAAEPVVDQDALLESFSHALTGN